MTNPLKNPPTGPEGGDGHKKTPPSSYEIHFRHPMKQEQSSVSKNLTDEGYEKGGDPNLVTAKHGEDTVLHSKRSHQNNMTFELDSEDGRAILRHLSESMTIHTPSGAKIVNHVTDYDMFESVMGLDRNGNIRTPNRDQ